MSKIEAKIIDKQVIKTLVDGLADFEKDKAIKEGLLKGGQVLARGGRSRLRGRLLKKKKGTGNLLKSIAPRVKRKKLGVLAGFRRPMGNHSHLIDRGTTDRRTKKGYNRGRVKPTLFWTDTEENDMQNATIEIFDGIEKAVNKIKQRL